VIYGELILSGIVNGFFFTIRFITLYRGICGSYGSPKAQLVSAAHSSGHTVLFTGEKCICCVLVGLM
jgi:hypothetical protein